MARTALVLAGHGSHLSPETAGLVWEQVDALRALNVTDEVTAAFWKETPSFHQVIATLTADEITIVPLFTAQGYFTETVIPAEIGLAPGQTQANINGRSIYYTTPVDAERDLASVILHLARTAGANLREPSSAGAWDGFPAAGRDELLEAVRAAGWIEFGELTLTLHEVRPTEIDIDREIIEFDAPTALRHHLRQQPFRPLATSTDLPRDWVVRLEKRAQLHAVVETVYPGAVADWARRAALPVTSLNALAHRQPGMYRRLSELSAGQTAQIVAEVCGRCVRQPTWHNGVREPLPCAEACSLWISRALEMESE